MKHAPAVFKGVPSILSPPPLGACCGLWGAAVTSQTLPETLLFLVFCLQMSLQKTGTPSLSPGLGDLAGVGLA